MRFISFLIALGTLIEIASSFISYENFPMSSGTALQLLSKLGLSNKSSGIRIDSNDDNENSSVYYIKLPPMPYFYSPKSFVPYTVATEPPQLTQIPIDFTNNGRPSQIRHWSHDLGPSQNPYDMLGESNIASNQIDHVTPEVEETKVELVSLEDDYLYNGKPTGIYIWKPKKPLTPSKYKNRYYRHFNY